MLKLRIGNWVKDKYAFTESFQIESIGREGFNISASDDGKPYGMHIAQLDYEYNFDDIFGILLSEEWLLKFGFKEIDGEWTNPEEPLLTIRMLSAIIAKYLSNLGQFVYAEGTEQ